MEKILSGDEKIRRAEEIYYRRKMGVPASSRQSNENVKTYLGSKILLDILLIVNLSIIIIAVQNKDFIFTEVFLAKISEYNVNLTQGIKSLINLNDEIKTNGGINSNTDVNMSGADGNFGNENSKSENYENFENKNYESEFENKSLDGEMLKNEIVPNIDEASSISQMDLDIEKIKSSYSFTKPIQGTVTSGFGARESVYQNVTGYHTGIDIGATKGTSIVAASSGKVVLVSSQGDYGKHLKIENGDMQTLYAHCSKILVKENDYIEAGQEIAQVGSTGNSTGPHLHFEIRYEGRFVDPSRIIEF